MASDGPPSRVAKPWREGGRPPMARSAPASPRRRRGGVAVAATRPAGAAPPSARSSERDGYALAAVVAAAAIFRLLYFLQYRATSLFYDAPYADARVYDQWARAIAAGTYRATGPYYLAPGYPYALAFLYRHVSAALPAVYVVQLALGLVDIVLVHRLAADAFGRRAGLLAAILTALYAPFPFLETKVLSATLAITTLLFALTALAGARERGGWWRWMLGGVLLGVTSLVRPETLLFAAFVPVWLWGWGRPPRVAGWAATSGGALLVLAGWAVAIAPVAVHNVREGGGGALIASQGALTFYQSNNPRACGFFVLLSEAGFAGSAETQAAEERAIAERAVGHPLPRREVSAYWFGRGLDFIAAQPARFVWLLGQKLAKFAGSVEYGTEFNLAVERETLWLLWVTWVPFTLILALAIPSLVRRPLHPTAALLLFAFLANLAAALIFYVSSRYRLASVPPLIAFAASTLDGLVVDARAARRRFPTTAAAVRVAFALGRVVWGPTTLSQRAAA